jgi:hypothetical protein
MCAHLPEQFFERCVRLGTHRRGGTLLDAGHDRVGALHLIQSERGRDDELGAPVGRVRAALHVTEVLQFVDEFADDLLVLAGLAGQVGGPAALGVQVGQHRAVLGPQPGVPLTGECAEQLALNREQQLTGEHAEIRVPLLAFTAAHRPLRLSHPF